MQTSNRFLDDLAKVANGAVSTAVGVKDEIETIIRHRLEKLLANADLVPREEFEAVKAMASEARAEQERIAERLDNLEKTSSKPRRRPPAKTSVKSSKPTRKSKK